MLKGYAICTTPRSGSNYLCELLTSTGKLGRPLEYFNPLGRRVLEAPNYPLEPAEHLAQVITTGATPNGVYALKMFPNQLHRTLAKTEVFSNLPQLSFVRLLRRDVLGQAISWARALQTEQYRATQTTLRAPEYDSDTVVERLADIVCGNASWDLFFARKNMQPLTLYYEDIEVAPLRAAEQISALMGVANIEPDITRVTLTRQRDALSDEWRRRFVDEHGQDERLHLVTPPAIEAIDQ